MPDVRSTFKITVDGEGSLTRVEKSLEGIATKGDKAQSSLTKFGCSASVTLGGVAGKVDMLSGGMTNLGGIVSRLSNPWLLAGAAISGAAVAMAKTVEQGGKITDLSAKFRISTDDIQRLGNAGAMSGVSMEDFASGIFKLRKNLADVPEKFRELGINVAHWKSLGGAELALEFARAMEAVKDDSEAAAVGTELAGKGFLSMAAALKSSDLEEAMRRQVAMTQEQVEKADELGDSWERVKQNINAATSSASSKVSNFYAGGVVKMAQKWDSYFGTNLSAPSEEELQAKIAQNAKNDPSVVKPDIGAIFAENKVKEAARKENERKAKEWSSEKKRREAEELRAAEALERSFLKAQADNRKESDKFYDEQRDTFLRKTKDAADEVIRIAKEEADYKIEQMERREKRRAEIDEADMKAQDEQRERGLRGDMNAEKWAAYNSGFERAIDSAQRMAGLFGTLREGLTALGFGAESFAMAMAVGLEMGAAAKAQMLASRQKNDKLGMASAGAGALMSAYKGGSVLGGAATGAMTGSAFGPWGAVAGGVIGGIAGLFGKKSAKDKAKEKYKDVSNEDMFSQMASKTEYATKDFLKLMSAAKGTAAYTEWMGKNLDLAAGGVGKMVDAMQYLGKDGAVAVAGTFSSSFWNTLRQKGLSAATETFGPIFDKVSQQLTEMGLDPTSMGMDRVKRMMDIGRDPKTAALLGAVQGNADFLKGTLNSGYLNTTDLANSGKIASSTYNELRNQGLDARESYEQMADYLSAVQRASEASGQKIPDEIQRMIEEARANGIEFTKQPIDQLAGYTKEIRDFLLGKGISSSSPSSGGGSNVSYDASTGTASGWGPRPPGYPSGMSWPPDSAPSMGGGGYVEPRPGGTLVRLAERGEGEIVTPVSRAAAGGGMTVVLGGPSFSPTTTAQDRRELAEFHARETVRGLRTSALVRYESQRAQRQWRRR